MSLASLFDLTGHSVLVTGAASGLGLAFAETMLEAGARTLMTDMDAQALDAQGNPLLYPLQYSSDTPSLADITNITPDFMHATIGSSVRLSTPAPVTITVTEPNSGTTATAQVIVGP